MKDNIIDRRNGPDTLVKLSGSLAVFSRLFVFIIVIFSWILVSTIFIVAYVAKAPFEEFLEHNHAFRLPAGWHTALIGYSLYVMMIMFLVCAAGLVCNCCRHHRKTDTYNRSLIFFGILSISGIILHLIYF